MFVKLGKVMNKQMEFLLLYGFGPLVLGLIALIWSKIANATVRDDNGETFNERLERQNREFAEREKQQEERKKQLTDAVVGGTWEFPCNQLYTRCRRRGVLTLKDEFEKQTVREIADDICKETAPWLPEYVWKKYKTATALSKYFSTGKRAVENEELAIREANLSENEKNEVAKAEKLASLYGKEKRKFMLRELIEGVNSSITKYASANGAADKMASVATAYAAAAPKEDWAILGGIAEGIAGPAAGAAVAMNAMQENAKAKKEHMDMATSLYVMGLRAEAEAKANIEQGTKERDELLKRMTSVSRKKVFGEDVVDEKELFRLMEIKATIKKEESAALRVQATVNTSSNFCLGYYSDITAFKNISSKKSLAIDGTLLANVYCGRKLVGTALLPLPIDGIGKKTHYVRLEGICKNYCWKDDYTVKFSPHKLWLIEQ